MSRFQKFMRRFQFIGPYRPLKRPTFLTDDELEIRRAVARELLGDTPVKPVLTPVRDWPRDGNGSPLEDLPIG